MCLICSVTYTVVAPSLLMLGTVPVWSTLARVATTSKVSTSSLYDMRTLPSTIGSIKPPDIQSPQWLNIQEAAAAAAKEAAGAMKTVTYTVTTKGIVAANLGEFKAQANASLNDSRGWSRLGVKFQEVASSGSFTLVLSEASQVPSFSSGCSAEYSCRVGQYVIINQDRWMNATPSWNAAGGSLLDYRHMVVNHETGHWLGHSHESCSGVGQAASVMQQQSIDLQGCHFNAWPLASELWATQIGVDKL